jgi:hypothetical protein
MNRNARRAAKGRGQIDRTVAVHEAGHAVGRILTSDLLGWSADEIIFHIDIHPVPLEASHVSADGTRTFYSEATCYGQMLSRPMDEFLKAKKLDLAKTVLDDLAPIFAEMRVAEIDLKIWHLAKCVECVFGPIAEAKLTNQRFAEIWNEYSSEADFKDAVRYGMLCGMANEQISATIERAITIAEEKMALPEIWAAIIALAAKLKPGRMLGRRAAQIVMSAMERTDNAVLGRGLINT